MWYVICVFIGLVVGAGSMAVHDHTLPPKTQIINNSNKQDVQTSQTTIQRSDQSQTVISVTSERTNLNLVTIRGDGKTNTYLLRSSKSNSSHFTNNNGDAIDKFIDKTIKK